MKDYHLDTLVANIAAKYGEPTDEGQVINSVDEIRYKDGAGDKTELVIYKAVSKKIAGTQRFSWEIETFKPAELTV